MKKLNEIQFKLSYRTGREDLVQDFFMPCLEASTLYRRAAGYFTSAGLALAARGIAGLASRGGKMQLVTSPYLDPDDVLALQKAKETPEQVLSAITARSLVEIEDSLIQDRLNALAWLAATNLLQIKLALRIDDKGNIARGIYHEKIGIFTDEMGNHVSFSGSSNETAGGLVENFESIRVFCSWKEENDRVKEDIADFNALWENTIPGIKVIEFSAVAKNLLERFRDPKNPPEGLPINSVCEEQAEYGFKKPSNIELRDYQTEAIRAWINAGGKGILSMATGSGKTIVALTLAAKVAEKNKPLIVIVVCPYISLCNQWIGEMASFGIKPIACFQGRNRWESQFEEGYQSLSLGLSKIEALVVTNATFLSEIFQKRLKTWLDQGSVFHFLIADEVHNLGSNNLRNVLPQEIPMRLGLSATPERYMDPIGTETVFSYFGNTVYEYSLSQAITDRHLCPYKYYPLLIQLTDDEIEQYIEISSQLSKFFSNGELKEDKQQGFMRLLVKRARLLAACTNKLHKLVQVISSMKERPQKAIFYCGDGRTTDTIRDEETRQIQAVSRLLGDKHGLRVRNFTYRETPKEREEILQDLESGFLDGVVAIRCLDEGIDLPDLHMAFLLASSTNPRQFIQRRGRLLRNSPGKDRALIYDFIIEPPDLGGNIDDECFNIERRFFQKELKRIVDFCCMAENGHEALNSLKELRLKYNLISE